MNGVTPTARSKVSESLVPSGDVAQLCEPRDPISGKVFPVKIRLKQCPASGEGVHRWVYYAACRCVEAGLTNDEAEEIIEGMMTRDPNPPSEIEDALRSARGERKPGPRWTPALPHRIGDVTASGPSLVELVARSPQPIQFGQAAKTEQYIDALFPGDPLLCVGKTDSRFFTARRATWRGLLGGHSLIVPSPMTAEKGRTKQGKLSYHSEANTGSRRFLVVEFDSGTLDRQAALIYHLAQYAPLALVVFSGSKSAHSWFFCEGQSEDKLTRFFDYATSLGADPKTWSRSQFVRMPDGTRSDGKTSDALAAAGIPNVPKGRQAVLYFNPGVIR